VHVCVTKVHVRVRFIIPSLIDDRHGWPMAVKNLYQPSSKIIISEQNGVTFYSTVPVYERPKKIVGALLLLSLSLYKVEERYRDTVFTLQHRS